MVPMTNAGRSLSGLLAAVVATLVLPAAVAAQDEAQAMLDSYCVRCHNERTLTANLALDKKDLANVAADAPHGVGAGRQHQGACEKGDYDGRAPDHEPILL